MDNVFDEGTMDSVADTACSAAKLVMKNAKCREEGRQPLKIRLPAANSGSALI